MRTHTYIKLSKNHNFLNTNVAKILLYESPDAQDTFWPTPGLISCAGVTQEVWALHDKHMQHRWLASWWTAVNGGLIEVHSSTLYADGSTPSCIHSTIEYFYGVFLSHLATYMYRCYIDRTCVLDLCISLYIAVGAPYGEQTWTITKQDIHKVILTGAHNILCLMKIGTRAQTYNCCISPFVKLRALMSSLLYSITVKPSMFTMSFNCCCECWGYVVGWGEVWENTPKCALQGWQRRARKAWGSFWSGLIKRRTSAVYL